MVTQPPLPAPPRPQGNYVPATRRDGVVSTAGMTPRVEGELVVTGCVGEDVDLARARHGAEIAAANALAAVVAEAGSADRIIRLTTMTVFVRAVPRFTAHSTVADAATDVLVAQLGEAGRCARSAVGVASLPGGSAVEIELTAQVEPSVGD